MTLFDTGPTRRRCMVYCGDDLCTCEARLSELLPRPGELCGGPARNRMKEIMNDADTKKAGNGLNVYRDRCHKASSRAGWWDGILRDHEGNILKDHSDNMDTFCTKIALIHSEVSEMLEGLRKSIKDDHLPERTMEEVEAADILIRLFDYAGARGLDLEGALHEKLEYNKKRPDHKPEARAGEGGKKF